MIRAAISGHLIASYHPQALAAEVFDMMLDWQKYRKELAAGVRQLAVLSPETVKGYTELTAAGRHRNVLGGKTRELIALAVAVTVRCDGCIAVHSEAARRLGATDEEIAEALGVATAVNAGATVVYSTRVMEAAAQSAEVRAPDDP